MVRPASFAEDTVMVGAKGKACSDEYRAIVATLNFTNRRCYDR